MNLTEAQNLAVDTCFKLQPVCRKGKINIAGSIRRRKPEVKDIEIICLPKMDVSAQDNLFGTLSEGIETISKDFIETINSLAKIVKGKADGKMMQIKLPENIMLDLFMPDDFDYYRQLAIRTGSADYSYKVIAAGWKNIGWCGSDKGLRKMSDCVGTKKPDGKTDWKCINKNAELPPIWESEQDFFDWIKVKWIHPSKRNI